MHEDNPAWAPDGAALAYDACVADSYPCPGSPNYEIFKVSMTARMHITRLTDMKGIDGAPAFSPDGAQIVFRSDRTGDTQLWKMNADGSNPTQLTFRPWIGGVDPAWQSLPAG